MKWEGYESSDGTERHGQTIEVPWEIVGLFYPQPRYTNKMLRTHGGSRVFLSTGPGLLFPVLPLPLEPHHLLLQLGQLHRPVAVPQPEAIRATMLEGVLQGRLQEHRL